MKVVVVAVGKVKERGLREALDDYAGRIARYVTFDEVELKDGEAADVAAKMERALGPKARVVALEVDGQAMSSEGLAKLVGDAERRAVGQLVFLVGGAYGLPPAISARADVKLSLSAMTLPHRLARLVLFEQIYRAYTILHHAPYSH